MTRMDIKGLDIFCETLRLLSFIVPYSSLDSNNKALMHKVSKMKNSLSRLDGEQSKPFISLFLLTLFSYE